MKSLDTNVVLRFLLRDIPDQSARALAAVAADDGYVSDVVVTETVFVLEKVYGAPRDTISLSMRSFLALPTLTSNAPLLREVFDLYEAWPALSIVDCYATIEAKIWNSSLLTFDKNLLKHGGAHVSEP